MKRKTSARRSSTRRRVPAKRLHHRIISHFRGDGGIYAIFILATAMAGAFALTGGILPQLNPNPPAESQVAVDEDSANQSSESALQLVDLKIKPTNTPTPPVTVTPAEVCYDSTALAILVDVSGSMADHVSSTQTKMDVLKKALTSFTRNFTDGTIVGLFAFSTNQGTLVPIGTYAQNKTQMSQQIAALRPAQFGNSTNTRQGLQLVYNSLQSAIPQYPNDRFSVVFFTDGVPENSECAFNDADERYRADNGTGPICANTFSDHPEHPGPISSQIKTIGARIYTVALYKQPPYSSTTQAAIETVMKNVASNPDEQYYIGLPNATNLEQAYNSIARRICQ